jgi:hypothetical protein
MNTSELFRRKMHNNRVQNAPPPPVAEVDPDQVELEVVTKMLEFIRGRRNAVVQKIIAKTGEVPAMVFDPTSGKLTGPTGDVIKIKGE